MNTVFKGTDKIGDIVASFPKASEIFRSYKIDFCCGGNRPLSEAIREQNIDENEVVDQLNKVYQETKELLKGDTDWLKASSTELIDYVVGTHHAFLQKELPIISELATKILRVHGIHHGEVLTKLHKLFHNLKMELEQHLIKEEEILFPLIKEYEKNPTEAVLDRIINVMRETESEHVGAGDILKELRKITDDYTLPEGVCTTFALTYRKIQDLEADLFQHIHLENNILFPRLEREAEENCTCHKENN